MRGGVHWEQGQEKRTELAPRHEGRHTSMDEFHAAWLESLDELWIFQTVPGFRQWTSHAEGLACLADFANAVACTCAESC